MSPRKADQDQWLAEAAEALAEAERLTGLLALLAPRRDLTLATIQSEIMAVRGEVIRIQRERAGERRPDFHPQWLEVSAWTSR